MSNNDEQFITDEDIEAQKWLDENTPTHEEFAEMAEHCKQKQIKIREDGSQMMETIKEEKGEVSCLICDKNLEYDEHGCVYDGGSLQLSFGYGSKFDLCCNHREPFPENATQLDKLCFCDQIEAYICDECFEKKADKIKGFMISKETKRERKV